MTYSDSNHSLSSAWYAVVLLSLAYMISILDRIAISLLVTPIKNDLSLSDTEMGLLLGVAFGVFYSVMGLPMGRMVDRYNRRNLIVCAIISWSIMTIYSGFAQNYTQLFIARMGVGIGEAVLAPAAWSMVSDLFPPEKRAKPLGCISIGSLLGGGIGFVAAAWLLDASSLNLFTSVPYLGELAPWRTVLVLAGIPGFAVALLLLAVKEPSREQKFNALNSENKQIHPKVVDVGVFLWRHRSSLGLVFIGAGLLVLTFYSNLSWMPTVLVRQYGLSVGDAGYLFGITMLLCSAPGVYIGGHIADKQASTGNENIYSTLFMCAALGIALSMLGLAGSFSLWSTLLCIGLFHFSYGLLNAPIAAFIARLTPANMRGLVSAVYVLTVNMMGYVLGPPLVAALSDSVQSDGRFLGSALISVCLLSSTIALAIFYISRNEARQACNNRQSSFMHIQRSA